MKKNLLVVLLTSAFLITFYEMVMNSNFSTDKEKYLNPLSINKGLIQSIRKNHEDHIDKYLSYSKLKINTETHNGNTPLFEAIMNNDISEEYFKKILTLSDINHINKNSFRPIHIAITAKKLKKVKIICKDKRFNPEVLYDGKNLVSFSKSLKDNEKNIRDRLLLNELIDFLEKKCLNTSKKIAHKSKQ